MTELSSFTAASALGDSISLQDLLIRMRQRGTLQPALREAMLEQVVLHSANQAGINVTTQELQQAADAFRQVNGLTSAEQTIKWLSEGQRTIQDFEAVLERDL